MKVAGVMAPRPSFQREAKSLSLLFIWLMPYLRRKATRHSERAYLAQRSVVGVGQAGLLLVARVHGYASDPALPARCGEPPLSALVVGAGLCKRVPVVGVEFNKLLGE